MRRAIKEKLTGILDDPRMSSTTQSLQSSDGRRQMTDRVVGFVKEKSGQLVTTVQEHVSSVTDMTGALAKQKLLQTLFSSGVVQSEHIRQALQIGTFFSLTYRNNTRTSGYVSFVFVNEKIECSFMYEYSVIFINSTSRSKIDSTSDML